MTLNRMVSDDVYQLNFNSFRQRIQFDESEFYGAMYQSHDFQIANQRIAIRRLKKICDATFDLANEVGFQSMTLRQLSDKSGMSMGGLYAYISSKEELAEIIYSALNNYCQKQIARFVDRESSATSELQNILRCHLYLSELLQPWFYFAYMEARSLNNQVQMAIESEMVMENRLTKLIRRGIKSGEFEVPDDSPRMLRLTAALIMAMLQDWYLKRGKYQKRRITVDRYADQLIRMSLNHLQNPIVTRGKI